MEMSFNRILKSLASSSAGSALGAAFVAFGGFTYALKLEPGWIEIKPMDMHLPRLDKEFNGYRLVQISDIHMDGWMTAERLEEIVTAVNRLHPDLVAITGDFVTHHAARFTPALQAVLGRLRARDGVVFVLGNHDHWSNSNLVRLAVEASGATHVGNDFITLKRGKAELHVAGVDDILVRKARLDLVLARLPVTGAAILLAHEPDFADISAKSGRFDMQISGHSHGGQIALPFLGTPYLPRGCHKYPKGLYQVGNMIQYTNRGLGMVHLPARFNCRPEITVFTLKSTSK